MTCGMKVASAFFDSRLTGPAEPDRRHHVAGVVAERRRDASHAELALLVLDGAAAGAHAVEHLPERLRIGDGLRRARAPGRRASPARPLRAAGTPGSPGPRRCNGRACARRHRSACGSACVLSRLKTYMISLPSSTARCTVSLTFSRRSRSSGRASFDTFMRRRTSEPSRNSAMPSRYFPVSGFCSSMPSATSVTARRCTVLLATPSRLASSLMPISTCSSENALSSRTEVATEDSAAGFGGVRWRAGVAAR